MKMKRLQYTFNDVDLDTCCQGHDLEQLLKDFSRQSLLLKSY